MLESLIERGGYSRNRKRITSRLGISSAALSQYIRQQTWPSFTKLLAIADFFDVSLDYLVYGEPAGGSLVDYGPLYRYFDHALADVQARGSRHSVVVARIGRMLADRIDEVAAELVATPAAGRAGLMQDEELLRLERYCYQCDLVSLNLEFDVIQAASGLAPGRFLSVVAGNLENGAHYRYVLPQDQPWDPTVEAFRGFFPTRWAATVSGRTAHSGLLPSRYWRACCFIASIPSSSKPRNRRCMRKSAIISATRSGSAVL